jgi:hypothetical protein
VIVLHCVVRENRINAIPKNPFSEFLIVLFNFLSILGRGRADLKLKGEMKNENYTKEAERRKQNFIQYKK